MQAARHLISSLDCGNAYVSPCVHVQAKREVVWEGRGRHGSPRLHACGRLREVLWATRRPRQPAIVRSRAASETTPWRAKTDPSQGTAPLGDLTWLF